MYQSKGEVDAALAAYREALKQDPNNPDVHNNLGLALLEAGDERKGVEEFQTALRLRPNDVGYMVNLGAAYLQMSEFDSALAQFQKALGDGATIAHGTSEDIPAVVDVGEDGRVRGDRGDGGLRTNRWRQDSSQGE